ncbi:MAG: hypothetical protein J1F31_00805 [Erysipelotrichales bacterium]|nr:hypothetical protein [Erysipelotrichales bacterium]
MAKIVLESEDKKLFTVSFIAGAIISVVLIVIAILNIVSYKVVASFLIGLLTGNAMHYLTIRAINKSRVESYKIVVRQLSLTKQAITILTLVAIYLLTKDIWAFIACVGGLTIIKLSIVIFVLMGKKNG